MNPRLSPARAGAAAVALCGLLAGCAGTSASENGAGGNDNRFISGNGNVTEFKPGDRKSVQDVEAEGLAGGRHRLADLKGKVVVVNFWASWCAPCRGEAPSLEQVYSENKAKGVEFLGVNFKDAKENGKAFERKFKVTYPSMFDADGRVTLAFREVPPSAIPSTLVLDRQGRIAARVIGATTYSKLGPLVAKTLAEK
ncbi:MULTISPECIES: TlpA disulfide reductase family protein [Actinomadura]|uniref:Redoxin domain-containing protein n=1 Tax=Actinomadura litoris TaxID=2678616 RepID=A0A7K1LDJ5_9ACTN|nr:MULTISPECIES: TlpA disulfide reductase family protein [Actinomadura]MBT2210248.1 TlpA family protein disulfide reductase [Actinomadura sp. NEAU-AAG7]MUN42488.1 redoxin domain-containing protein [Actinomadura litoris]